MIFVRGCFRLRIGNQVAKSWLLGMMAMRWQDRIRKRGGVTLMEDLNGS